MSVAKDIQAAEALSTKATQKELSKDFDVAFELYIKAAQAFIHLASTATDVRTRESCKAAVGKALDRAEQIKKFKRDVRPVVPEPYSAQEQLYILDKSSLVNGLRYPSWKEPEDKNVGVVDAKPFQDPDGQPALASSQQLDSVRWRRPSFVFPQTQCMTHAALLPEHIVQSLVTDCSVVAAIAVCLGHQRRFGSTLGMSSLYPQDRNCLPMVSKNGEYAVRVFVNGAWRKIGKSYAFHTGAPLIQWVRSVVDDTLPFLPDGRLLGVSAGEHNVLWPPLLEKAYMKFMGGYDFPGSNSGTDLHTLVGWIPEHVHIRSAGFRMEGTWTRIFQSFLKGTCLVTLGTPSTSSDVPFNTLIPAHSYAVTDMQDDGSERYITLLDPWRDRNQDLQQESSSMKTGPGSDTSKVSSPILRFDWRDACNRFDTIHLNWNPSMFPHQLRTHGIWKLSKPMSKNSHSVSNRIRVFIKGAKSRDEEAWVLLTRHVVAKDENRAYISLNVNLHDESRTVPSADKPSVQGIYSDSVHVLRRFSPGTRDCTASIVVSLDEIIADTGYTVTVLSPMEVNLDTQPRKGLHSKTVDGALTARSSGGNFTYPTFMNNPQYRLQLRSDPSSRDGPDHLKAPVIFSVEGSKDLPLNVKIVWSQGQRITELVQGDIVADTGAYSYGVAYGESDLKVGDYIVVVSSFEPRQQGPFELCVHSMRAFDLDPIQPEGAGMYTKLIRGAWQAKSSAGSPSFGGYHSNPVINISIPSATQIMIRLQLTSPSPSISLNVTLFAEEASGFGRQVSTSGPYADAIAGVLLPRSVIAPGNYLLVPSTHSPGIEAGFQVLLYSTGAGVEMSLRG